MNSDVPETPAFTTAEPKPKLPLLLKLAIALSSISLLCCVIIIVIFRPPFVLNFAGAEILFGIAYFTGLISVPLYIAAIIFVRNQRFLTLAIGLASLIILNTVAVPTQEYLRNNGFIAICQYNLKSIRTAINQYSQTNNSLLPAPNWCDVLILKYNIRPTEFMCKNTNAQRDQSSYALNKNLIGRKLTDANPDTVMLFETKPGWNQIRDANDLSLNHGTGCNILFANGRIRFVPKDQISNLRWKP
jgi:hypothetical protein